MIVFTRRSAHMTPYGFCLYLGHRSRFAVFNISTRGATINFSNLGRLFKSRTLGIKWYCFIRYEYCMPYFVSTKMHYPESFNEPPYNVTMPRGEQIKLNKPYPIRFPGAKI